MDWETIVYASEDVPNVVFTAHDAPNNPGVGCVITDMDDLTEANESKGASAMTAVLCGGAARMHSVLRGINDTEIASLGMVNLNMGQFSN